MVLEIAGGILLAVLILVLLPYIIVFGVLALVLLLVIGIIVGVFIASGQNLLVTLGVMLVIGVAWWGIHAASADTRPSPAPALSPQRKKTHDQEYARASAATALPVRHWTIDERHHRKISWTIWIVVALAVGMLAIFSSA
jgi:hypothetical protein